MSKKLMGIMTAVVMLFALSVTAFAADTEIAFGGNTLTNGYYAFDEVSGSLNKLSIAEKPDYFEYKDGTITVYGDVKLVLSSTDSFEIKSGTLTVTGEEGASLTIDSTADKEAVIKLGDQASLLLDGSVDFAVTASAESVSRCFVGQNSSVTTSSSYNGDIYISANASSMIFLNTHFNTLSAGKVTLECSGNGSVSSTNKIDIVASDDVSINCSSSLSAVNADVTVKTAGDFSFQAINGYGVQNANLTVNAKSVYTNTGNYNATGNYFTVDGGDVNLNSNRGLIAASSLSIIGADNVSMTGNSNSNLVGAAAVIDADGAIKISNIGPVAGSGLTVSNSASLDISVSYPGSATSGETKITSKGLISIVNNGSGSLVSGPLEINGAADVNLKCGSGKIAYGDAIINAADDVFIESQNSGDSLFVSGSLEINCDNVKIYGNLSGSPMMQNSAEINAKGTVDIKNSGSGFIAGNSLTINGATDVNLSCSYLNGPAVSSSIMIDATGDILIENKKGFVTSKLTVINANNVTVHGNSGAPTCSSGMDIDVKGNVEAINYGSGLLAAGVLNIKAADVTLEANTSSPMFSASNTDIDASGDVNIKNNGTGFIFSSATNNISGKNVCITGTSNSTPLVTGSLTIDAEENAEVINNGSAILVSGSAEVNNAKNVTLSGNCESPLIVGSLTLTNCVKTSVENTAGGYVATNLTISGNATETVDIIGNRDIAEDPEYPLITDAVISGSISVSGVKPTASVSITNKSGQKAFCLDENHTLTTQLGVLRLNGEAALNAVADGTELPEAAFFIKGKVNRLVYSVASAEGVTDELTYEWFLDGVLTEETSNTFDLSEFSQGVYKVVCRVTIGNVTLVSAETTATVKVCVHEATEIRNAVAATAENVGYTGDTYCTECGELLEKGTEIPNDTSDSDEFEFGFMKYIKVIIEFIKRIFAVLTGALK